MWVSPASGLGSGASKSTPAPGTWCKQEQGSWKALGREEERVTAVKGKEWRQRKALLQQIYRNVREKAVGNPNMASQGKNFGQQLSDQINDALSRLASKDMFQTDWDIAAFAIFFIFIGAVLFLVLLVLIRCLCCCCCDCERSGSYHKAPRKVGIDNRAMEP